MLLGSLHSIANMTSDADRLKQLLARLTTTKKQFARDAGIPGGDSMVSQHLSGNRPVSVEAAIAYARGLGCSIDEVSPDAAKLLRDGAALLAGTESSEAPAAAAPINRGAQTLSECLATVLDVLATLPPARAVSVRAQLDLAMSRPEMRDDALTELVHLLASPGATSGKRTGTAG